MPCKIESQFKHRDESSLNSASGREAHDSEKARFAGKTARIPIWFTVTFGETITIATSAGGSRRVNNEFRMRNDRDAASKRRRSINQAWMRALKNEGVGEHVRIRFLADLAPVRATSVDEIADYLSAPLEARR